MKSSIKDLIDQGFVLLYEFKKQGGVVEIGDTVSSIFEKEVINNDFGVDFYQNISDRFGHDQTLYIKKRIS